MRQRPRMTATVRRGLQSVMRRARREVRKGMTYGATREDQRDVDRAMEWVDRMMYWWQEKHGPESRAGQTTG